MSDCLEVCIKISGCNLEDNKYNKDTHKICKLNIQIVIINLTNILNKNVPF